MFLRHNAIYMVGSLSVAALNYLFYPVLGRMLSPADFGEVQALTSLFTQAAIFLTILTYVTVHVTVNVPKNGRITKTAVIMATVGMVIMTVTRVITAVEIIMTVATREIKKLRPRQMSLATITSLRTSMSTKAIRATMLVRSS